MQKQRELERKQREQRELERKQREAAPVLADFPKGSRIPIGIADGWKVGWWGKQFAAMRRNDYDFNVANCAFSYLVQPLKAHSWTVTELDAIWGDSAYTQSEEPGVPWGVEAYTSFGTRRNIGFDPKGERLHVYVRTEATKVETLIGYLEYSDILKDLRSYLLDRGYVDVSDYTAYSNAERRIAIPLKVWNVVMNTKLEWDSDAMREAVRKLKTANAENYVRGLDNSVFYNHAKRPVGVYRPKYTGHKKQIFSGFKFVLPKPGGWK